MRFVSLFAGIGGLDLGLERAGWECVTQVEWDPWCQQILNKHWPEVPKYADVRDVSGSALPAADAIVGGFPCQPVSQAGRQKGTSDERWLWPEVARLVGEIRPRYVVVENVPGLRSHGGTEVVTDLATLGYDSEWGELSAAAVGAPHLRNRFFLVAHTDTSGRDGRPRIFRSRRRSESAHSGQWATEPDMGRVAHGIPRRVDRLRGLGNAVVPQVAETLAHMIDV
ncbi:MAG: DNA (cytosine-5-)-methyltransferase [Actinobacteria bacterium]|nr:MAG: DNA (cytosine-5-)-methyltransferase [Actinomycetota bacterium]REK34100.1 MAG: DNA (cytosine-5-)-methyltransferase [Actinomycetota bacterium]